MYTTFLPAVIWNRSNSNCIGLVLIFDLSGNFTTVKFVSANHISLKNLVGYDINHSFQIIC